MHHHHRGSNRLHTLCARWMLAALWIAMAPLWAVAATCEARSGAQRTPVIELYTSEGCSSCPPADQWLSTLKGKPVVAQAFHVAYWDTLGWADRFATPAYTRRQEELAKINQLQAVYTPQVFRNGRDWAQWRVESLVDSGRPGAFSGVRFLNSSVHAAKEEPTAGAAIALQRVEQTGQYLARVTPTDAAASWSAYWTVTENGYNSHVKDGENKGAFLQHDFVVRQYVPVGRYQGAQTLSFAGLAPQAGHAQQINLVISDTRSGEPLQALSLQCN